MICIFVRDGVSTEVRCIYRWKCFDPSTLDGNDEWRSGRCTRGIREIEGWGIRWNQETDDGCTQDIEQKDTWETNVCEN